MLLAELVATSAAVAATRSRKAKVAALAETLARVEPAELEVVVSYLGGALRQRRTGLGWRGVSDLPSPADEPSLTRAGGPRGLRGDVAALRRGLAAGARRQAVDDLFGRATAAEQAWLRAVVTGNVRQGALDAVTQEAVAQVAEVPLAAVRRAAMLAGSTVAAAGAAFEGEEALAAIGLEVGRPIMPMLASSAPDVAAAMAGLSPDGATEVAIDAKLDGIRIQVHRDGDDVLVVTRSLDDITGRLPEVVEVARVAARRALRPRRRGAGPVRRRSADGLPGHREPHRAGHAASPSRPTSSTCSTSTVATCSTPPATSASPRSTRWCPSSTACAASSPPTPRPPTPSRPRPWPPATRASCSRTSSAPYAAGRRGSAWVKVKPVHTLDLVVLAVEWGSRPPRGLALQHPPRRPRPVVGDRLRDARQDLQGHDRRDARLADRALHRARRLPRDHARRLRRRTCGPSRSSRSPSTASSAPPAIPAASRCGSRG